MKTIDKIFERNEKPIFEWEESLPPLLLEQSVAELQKFNDFNPNDPRDLEAMWEVIYEIEYKYSMLRSKPFAGLEQRKDNILAVLEAKAKEIIPILAETLQDVFEEWLKHHAITNPEEWAKDRVEQLEEYGDAKEALYSLLSERERYTNLEPIYELEQIMRDDSDKFPSLRDILSNIATDRAYADYEDLQAGYMELDDFNQMYGLKAKSVEDAEDMISDVELDLDYFDLGDFFASLSDVMEWMSSREREDFLISVAQEIVFPHWYAHWKSEGIDKTRSNVERVAKQLRKINKAPLKDQFMTLNIAKETSHQTGSMMDYYDEMWQIGEQFFTSLSNTDVRDWNIELHEIGVEL